MIGNIFNHRSAFDALAVLVLLEVIAPAAYAQIQTT